MFKSYAFIVTVLFLFRCTMQELSEEECGKSTAYDDRTIKISLNSRKNKTGEWFDTFIARIETTNSSDEAHLDLTHRVTECDGKRIVYVKGVTKDASVSVEEIGDKLKFYPRTGTNIAISNKGFTAERINADEAMNSAVFTNRPLRNNEIFEVKIEKKVVKWNAGIGIGVTTVSPADVEILPQMFKSPTVWMLHDSNIYSNGKGILAYKTRNIDKLQVGERVGVMRTEFGVLHFFLNGVDQGPAVSNVPQTVYALIDLRHDDLKATIVDEKNTSQ